MIERKQLAEQEARVAMEQGSLDESVRKADKNVAVVFTQGWCPQWVSMNLWLGSMQRKGEPADLDITIFEFIYDRIPFFREFRQFKESTWGNDLIPYIRYYRDGELIAESNYVPSQRFLSHFSE